VRDYDVTDDQADQCYGGTRVEVPSSNTAVTATSGRVITYQGASIRAYFASSNGGYTLSDGCWMNNVVRSGSTWMCSTGQPYLAPVADPADRAVAAPSNPRASWTVTFTSSDVRSAVLRCGGPDIGALQAVDLSNQVPPGVGHPISVRVFGSAANADLRADDFLRNCLGLRSTMVRLTPF
jgi:stage II sporulation protein D